MHEDMRTLLNAYLDDGLHGTRLLEVKLHLASCPACREELKELRLVSDLLQAAPAPQFMPVERFVANLNLILPRRLLRDRPPKPGSLAWWLVPAALLALFYFVRTVVTLTSVVTVADVSGLLGSTAWLDAGQQAAWYGDLMSLFGGQVGEAQPALSTLNSLAVWGGNLLDGLLWQVGILLLYWGWLAVWWLRRGPRLAKNPATLSQS
jgi:hypothetical protein